MFQIVAAYDNFMVELLNTSHNDFMLQRKKSHAEIAFRIVLIYYLNFDICIHFVTHKI